MDETNLSRRKFMQGAIGASMALTGCKPKPPSVEATIKSLSPAQLAKRKPGRSSVALLSCSSYQEDITTLLKEGLNTLELPEIKNRRVLLKPNMVEFRDNNLVNTNAQVVAAAAQWAYALGAKEITVGEGPGHFRDMDFLLKSTGIGKVCSDLGLKFVDLNLDRIERVENPDGLKLKEFYMPQTILEHDLVISMPKLKTHHWVGMTASMKNMFGTVPGCKYGWPKNILHWQGISECIIDLMHIVRPSLAIVDGIEAMQGDGPINGTVANLHCLAVGTDLAAVDSTCARLMGIKPDLLRYLKLAEAMVGNTRTENIDIEGAALSSLAMKFELPPTFTNPELMKLALTSGS